MATTLSSRTVLTALLALAAMLPQDAAAAPAAITASAMAPTIAADGVTGLNALISNPDGSPYAGPPVTVTFKSACGSAGLARIQPQARSSGGLASSTYIATGCAGLDTVTVQIAGSPGLLARVQVYVRSERALSPKGSLGRAMFFDAGLSASGAVACASCHAPAAGYNDPGPGPTPRGGTASAIPGFRTAMPAAYALYVPRFAWQAAQPGAIAGALGTPRGGLMWDGRENTLASQARGPFTQPHEMANASNAAVLARLLGRPYAAAFAKVYGPTGPASDPDLVVGRMADAIAAFERQDASFHLFSSKYDRAQAGLASLTAQERHGQALFFDPARGACAGCHSSAGPNRPPASRELFSDQSFRAIGVPRNWALPYNDDAKAASALAALGLSALANGVATGAPQHLYYDLGACGPFRTDSVLDPGLCGAFRVPTLRNVALKHAYEHNGVFASLSQVIDFYNRREAVPGEIYRTADGGPDAKYNDLPDSFKANVRLRAPFRPLPGGAPRLGGADVRDLVAFLCTLTDGYDPAKPGNYALPAQCRAAQR